MFCLLAELNNLRKKHPDLSDKVLTFLFHSNREEEEARRAKEEAERREKEKREAEEKDREDANKRKNPSRSEYESLSKKVSELIIVYWSGEARLGARLTLASPVSDALDGGWRH